MGWGSLLETRLGAGLGGNEALGQREGDALGALDAAEHGLDEAPVDGLEPLLNVLLAVVSEVTVVGVLPEVDHEQGGDAAATDGVTGVESVDNLELTVVVDEPGVARAEDGLGVGLKK